LRRHGLSATFFVSTGYLDGGRMFNDSVVEIVRRAPGPALDLRSTVLGDLGVHDLATVHARQRTIEQLLPRIKPHPAALREEFCVELQRRAGVGRLPDDLMMTSDQVRAMHRAGMGIGGHTVVHPILSQLHEAAALAEIIRGRETLEDLIGDRVRLFAYPNGRPGVDYTMETVALVRRSGFDAAVSTAQGAAHRGSDPFQLPRFMPWDRSRLRFGLRMLGNLRLGREALSNESGTSAAA
jgi:peptidoglycan/xylan/chitin deacetylase (PgdA/CDA1 family)